MKRYCLDMSGFSNPLELMPEDIHSTMWSRIAEVVVSGDLAVTAEIYEELLHLPGPIGECIKKHRGELLLEIGGDWDWQSYIKHIDRMKVQHVGYISEYNGNRKGTIGLNDLSIIALGKTLGLPVINQEAVLGQVSQVRKRIPEVCTLESVKSMSFNDFLRAYGIKN